MSTSQTSARPTLTPTVQVLTNLPRGPLSPQEQLEALRRVQAQAEQRVKLGMQLFKAAEARIASHQDALEQVKAEQSSLREQVQEDVTRSLHAYDQWIGQIDESFTAALKSLEQRIDELQRQWAESEARIEQMVSRSEALLDQTRYLLAQSERSRGGVRQGATSAGSAASSGAAATATPAASAAPGAESSPPPPTEGAGPGQPIYSKVLEQLRRQHEQSSGTDTPDDPSNA